MAYFHLGRGVVLPTLIITEDDLDLSSVNDSLLCVWTSRGWDKYHDGSSSYRRIFTSLEEACAEYDTPVFARNFRLLMDWNVTHADPNNPGKVYVRPRALHGYQHTTAQFRVFATGGTDWRIITVDSNSNGTSEGEWLYSPFGLGVYFTVSAAGISTMTVRVTPTFETIGD